MPRLYPGWYHVKALARGHQCESRWIEITDQDIRAIFSLQPNGDCERSQYDQRNRRNRTIQHGKQCRGEKKQYWRQAKSLFSPQKTIRFLQLAQQDCPRTDRIHDALDEAYLKSKPRSYPRKAEHTFRTALKLNPNDERAHSGLDDIRQKKRSNQQAEKIIGGIFSAILGQ